MSPSRPFLPASLIGLAALLPLLGACSFADENLWPTLSGEDPRGTAAAQPASGVGMASTTGIETGGTSTSEAGAGAVGTGAGQATPAPGVGGRADELRGELTRLQNDVNQHISRFNDLKRSLDEGAATVETRLSSLRAGASATQNPQALRDWGEAQDQLNRLGQGVAQLGALSAWASSDVSHEGYILQAVRAANADPAVTDRQRRALTALETDAGHVGLQADQLLAQISGEIARRNTFLADARRRLAGLAPRAPGIAAGPQGATAGAPTGGEDRAALITIRFDRANVDYQQDLYAALKEALARRPDLALDVVAVEPPGNAAANGALAKRNIANVVGSLDKMGVPASRIKVSARTDQNVSGNEVRIYPR